MHISFQSDILYIKEKCYEQERLLKKPKDFTFEEMESLLSYFGYELKQGGTGSGVKFIKDGSNEVINFHKPHPSGILKRYVLDQVIEKLRKDGLL